MNVTAALRSFWSKQFAAWLAVFVPAFTVAALALDAASVPTWIVFGLGIVFGDVIDPVVDWFTDWYVADRRLGGVEP